MLKMDFLSCYCTIMVIAMYTFMLVTLLFSTCQGKMSESWCRCFACGYKWLNKHMYNSQIICEYVCTPSIALAKNFHPSIHTGAPSNNKITAGAKSCLSC